MAQKGLMGGLPIFSPGLEEIYPICLLNKATISTRVTTIAVSKYLPGFMIKIDFAFLNVESIHVSTYLLNIVTLLTLKAVLGDHPTILKNIDYLQIFFCQSKLSKKQDYCCSNCLCLIKTKSLSDYSTVLW